MARLSLQAVGLGQVSTSRARAPEVLPDPMEPVPSRRRGESSPPPAAQVSPLHAGERKQRA